MRCVGTNALQSFVGQSADNLKASTVAQNALLVWERVVRRHNPIVDRFIVMIDYSDRLEFVVRMGSGRIGERERKDTIVSMNLAILDAWEREGVNAARPTVEFENWPD